MQDKQLTRARGVDFDVDGCTLNEEPIYLLGMDYSEVRHSSGYVISAWATKSTIIR